MNDRFDLRVLLGWLKSRFSAPSDELVDRFCRDLRQGMVLNLLSTMELGRGRRRRYQTPLGVVLTSQTCDIVLGKSRTVQVAAIVQLDGGTKRFASQRAMPRYVPLPALSDNHFADLDHTLTLEKSHLLRLDRRDGVGESHDDQRDFAIGVGRRASRFAFPDEVVPWLEPIRVLLSKAALRQSGALRAVADAIEDLRLESSGWTSIAADLTLHLIVAENELAAEEAELVPPAQQISDFLATHPKAHAIAEALFPSTGPRPEGADRNALWAALADELAGMCSETVNNGALGVEVLGAVRSIDALVWTADEFSLSRLRRSERLDLTHLTSPTPLEDGER